MAVLLQNEVDSLPFDPHQLTQNGEKLLELVGHPESELSILLVSDKKMAEINKTYRHKDAATNVLSFPMNDEMDFGPTLLGDIVISVDTAVRESKKLDIPLEIYLSTLQVHGLVHLLGYDHEQGTQEALEMAAFEKRLLKKTIVYYQ